MKRAWFLLAAFGALVATRLPLMLSGHLSVDGDESILGLMALHATRGDGMSLTFWGQSYGLAAVEAGVAALLFRAFGVGPFALKLAMLITWSAGGALLVAAARRAAGTRAAVLALALVATCPAWLDWSMKARGGYVTAFAALGLAAWLAADLGSAARLAAFGAATALAACAQPIFAPAAAGLALGAAGARRSARDGMFVASGMLPVILVMAMLARDAATSWSPALLAHSDPVGALAASSRHVLLALAGCEPFGFPRGPVEPLRLLAGAAWLLAAVLAFAFLRRGGDDKPAPRAELTWGLALSLAAALVPMFVIAERMAAPRYLLPALPALLLLVALGVDRALDGGGWRRAIGRALVIVLVATGVLRVGLLARGPQPTHPHETFVPLPGEMAALVLELDSRGITRAYCLDPQLPWCLMFASRERIVARWLSATDRRAAYPEAVDDALSREESAASRPAGRVALLALSSRLGPVEATLAARGASADRLGATFVLIEPVTRELLTSLGFQLRPAAETDVSR